MKRTFCVSVLAATMISVMVVTLAFSAENAQDSPTCTIEKIVTASGVQEREPVGESTEFADSVGKVYCWMKITCPNTPVTVKHVWYKGDKKVFEFPLELKHATTRTWSVKGITSGDWKVDVVNDAGQLLGSVSFRVK